MSPDRRPDQPDDQEALFSGEELQLDKPPDSDDIRRSAERHGYTSGETKPSEATVDQKHHSDQTSRDEARRQVMEQARQTAKETAAAAKDREAADRASLEAEERERRAAEVAETMDLIRKNGK